MLDNTKTQQAVNEIVRNIVDEAQGITTSLVVSTIRDLMKDGNKDSFTVDEFRLYLPKMYQKTPNKELDKKLQTLTSQWGMSKPWLKKINKGYKVTDHYIKKNVNEGVIEDSQMRVDAKKAGDKLYDSLAKVMRDAIWKFGKSYDIKDKHNRKILYDIFEQQLRAVKINIL